MQLTKTINPFTGEVTEQLLNTAEVVSGIDAQGNYLGLVPLGTEFLQVPAPPADINYKWNFTANSWEYFEPLVDAKARAVLDIDSFAGNARLRYITDVPGQSAAYAAKLEQSQAYLANNLVIGSYLQAEASTLDISLQQAAEQIVQKAELWNNTIGPQIESIRRKYKLALDTAATPEQLFQIRNTAMLELAEV
jgi:hypothetical protein